MTNTKKNPRMYSIGVLSGLNRTAAARVAIQANICIAVGTDTAMLAADAKLSDNCGIPVANIWCTHRPKLRNPVEMTASTTSR